MAAHDIGTPWRWALLGAIEFLGDARGVLGKDRVGFDETGDRPPHPPRCGALGTIQPPCHLGCWNNGRLGACLGFLGNFRRLVVRVLDMIISVTDDGTRIGGRYMSYKPRKLGHVNIFVRNAERARDWYEDL